MEVFLRKRKKKKGIYGGERYKNLSKDENQKLVEYRKKYYKIWKNKKCFTNKDWLMLC